MIRWEQRVFSVNMKRFLDSELAADRKNEDGCGLGGRPWRV
jgi:hypothetical protein